MQVVAKVDVAGVISSCAFSNMSRTAAPSPLSMGESSVAVETIERYPNVWYRNSFWNASVQCVCRARLRKSIRNVDLLVSSRQS